MTKTLTNTIVKHAEVFVLKLFTTEHKTNLTYHNFEHTSTVVKRITEIAAQYELSEHELTALTIAGWFHDVGHLYTNPSEHEQKSIEIAMQWLDEKEEYQDYKEDVKRLIAVTQFSVQPQDLLEAIIKDADTYHFGTKDFKETDKLLKEEMRLRNMTTLLVDWKKNTLQMLQQHQFYTDYCQKLLEEKKQKNIEKLTKKTDGFVADNSSNTVLLNDDGGKNKAAAKQNAFLTKGIQTMLRLTSENHMRLSDMADTKANILISVNAIIISVILSVLIRKIEVDTHLTIPTFIFLGFSLATIILAIIATRPKITKGNFSREDVLERKTNLLFFGNFYKTELDEYKWGMSTMMRDPNYIYGGLIDDIYYLGKVLGNKYRIVSIAYIVFMTGIIISVIAFSLAIMLHHPAPNATITNGTGTPL
jgi:HD superfamily phosphodiesterase